MISFEEELEKSGKLIYTNVGVSMRPLIKQDRDLLVIEKPKGRLKKYDCPLYKRPNGQYVLHRVVKVCDDGYVILGDKRSTLTASDTGSIRGSGMPYIPFVLYL